MAEPPAPCVLIVADAPRTGELVAMLAEPLPSGVVQTLVSSGGDDTIDLFNAHTPHVVVVMATLDAGDSASLITALREMRPRSEVGFVLIGDLDGPIRTALDAGDVAPDRFVGAPVTTDGLRFAVNSVLDVVLLIRQTAELSRGVALPMVEASSDEARAARFARWGALADSVQISDEEERAEARSEPDPLPPPVDVRPRRASESPTLPTGSTLTGWKPASTAAIDQDGHARWPGGIEGSTREPTVILGDPEPAEPASTDGAVTNAASTASTMTTGGTAIGVPLAPKAADARAPSSGGTPIPLAGMLDPHRSTQGANDHGLDDLPDLAPPADNPAVPDGRDFARQLRDKMSKMAQRLFQSGTSSTAAPTPVDISPRHDAHTEIDLAALAEEPALDRGVTEIEGRRARPPTDSRELLTSPGSWETAVRERGLPDQGEIVRGLSDAAMLLAKMFAQSTTGRIVFRQDGAEKVVLFDQGRPVFASSNEHRDRMGELLVREGKITASQYERCQAAVTESGRRMGEILVDLGYLKRRELLPAVRRHVEDILYSLFGWERGTYQIITEEVPSTERIRLSRHSAALILEGIRRKFDRGTLDRLVGSSSTVIEVPDRERLGGIVQQGDFALEERGAVAAFDGQADLAGVARAAGVDIADVLPVAWGLCVLGLATARRTETEVPDETSALVGETDIAIDRERVRARWQLVDEADYFALLGVRRDATGFEIRRAYQSARRDFAADMFPNDLRRELARELDDIAHVLDEAFRVLRDDRLRLTYLSNLFE